MAPFRPPTGNPQIGNSLVVDPCEGPTKACPYPGGVKEFLVYTLMRLALLVGTFAVVVGIWFLVADSVNLFWAVLIAFVLSGIGSFFLLNQQREAFAQRLHDRAERARAAYEASKAKEDD